MLLYLGLQCSGFSASTGQYQTLKNRRKRSLVIFPETELIVLVLLGYKKAAELQSE